MIHEGKVWESLQAKRSAFASFEATQLSAFQEYGELWKSLETLTRADLDERLAVKPWPGARPSSEFGGPLIVPFVQNWQNHAEAQEWARETLTDQVTFAVDGSQLPPSKDYSIPVGAVQIGWFENPHAIDRPFFKSVDFEVLTPDELADDSGDGGFPDWRINMKRFQGEADRLIQRMIQTADTRNKPICFLDGSLVLSFVQHMRPDRQVGYVEAIVRLLETSEKYRVPLIGFVDTSYANDLMAMVATANGIRRRPPLSDGALLRSRMQWGDRTQGFICARDDEVLAQYGSHNQRIALVYLKTTSEGPPARLDVPLWMVEDGRLEQVLNVVRAECLVGVGYPYAAETADVTAVISGKDRETFYRLFQEFANQAALKLRYSRKALSKRRRR